MPISHATGAWFLLAAAGLPLAASEPLPGRLVAKDGSEMLLVPEGPFLMGSGDGRGDESPPHVVRLGSFYVDRTEVSHAQFARFVAETNGTPPPLWRGSAPPPEIEQLPVTNITWYQAMRYGLWAGKRLPTEAEWEKAARGADGRRFPWGNADDAGRRNVHEDKGLWPVDQCAEGASPYGCLNMSGNAWEWTADWYGAYRGSTLESVHYGRKYKSIRGGGGLYFYGIANTGLTFQRARVLPYGRHDGLGFRCVQDPTGQEPPYDPESLLQEAETRLHATLRDPVPLAHERDYAGMVSSGRVPLTTDGTGPRHGTARTGVPLPQGVIRDPQRLRVLAGGREALPTQSAALSRWADGSVRWALVDFPAQPSGEYELSLRDAPLYSLPAGDALRFEQQDQDIIVETGGLSIVLGKGQLVHTIRYGETLTVGPLRLDVRLSSVPYDLVALPADKAVIEESGPLHGVVRLQGRLGTAGLQPSTLHYDLRLHVWAGSTRVGLLLTLTNKAARESKPLVITSATLSLDHGRPDFPAEQLLGREAGPPLQLPTGENVRVLQADDLQYSVRGEKGDIATGRRCPGWLATRHKSGWCVVGVRHFWQNHPKELFCGPGGAGVRLWAGGDDHPFEWEGGLAKTHELIIDYSEAPPTGFEPDPLRVILPPAWVAGTEAAGPLVPRGAESLAAYPYWELLREWDMRKWARAMPTGMRDFGDAYFGGPYKGKNAFANLEYDVPWNFLQQFLRTGNTWYLACAEVQARHQADVDLDHFTGRQWKHSPLHTTTEADLGHVFIRGMLLHYVLTGERRSLESAAAIGDWLAPQVAQLKGIGNERQIGWSLFALTGLFDVTRDPKYLDAATVCALKLHDLQEPWGKFRIRWDNRISFFNGIAMSGLLEVYRHSGDERIAQTVLRLADRTLGQYPEYALRTLNAFCWAAERTGDPRYLNVVARTWESSMEFLMPREAATAETHASHFHRYALQHGLQVLQEPGRDAIPKAAGRRMLRLEADGRTAAPGMPSEPSPAGDTTLYVRVRGRDAAAMLVLIEGLTTGSVEVYDLTGARLSTYELTVRGEVVRSADFVLRAADLPYRLRLVSDVPVTWQIHHDDASDVVVHDPIGRYLPGLYPLACGRLREDAREVAVRLWASGEGFHSAVLYDSRGGPAGAVRRFVDFEDPGRYEMSLKVPVPAGTPGIWSLEVFDARVNSIEGFLPYWAVSAAEWFNPEQPSPLP